jgi:GNAT superfamily N-acetyltransferase
LGGAARAWAAPEHHEVGDDWWIACSGQSNVNYNVAFCESSDPTLLTERCLKPVLDVGRPAIIMLAGGGLAAAHALVESGWVIVGALPLMVSSSVPTDAPHDPLEHPGEVVALESAQLPLARALLADTYGLDAGSAAVALPDRAANPGGDGVTAWGLFDGQELAACFTGVVEDGMFVVWSMATRREHQGHGYGHHLLHTALDRQLEHGVTESLLQSSNAGERLYRGLGYSTVEHWQLWSRPRWVMAAA